MPATILAESSWFDLIFSPKGLGVALWSGLGVLTISLFLLSRTRWGQARPLSKCVALSLFAHILLVGYAYGTRLILDLPPPADRPVIKLSFVEPGHQGPQAPTEATEEARPWERFVTEETVAPDFTRPNRVDPQMETSPQRPQVTRDPPFETHSLTDALTPIEPQRPAPPSWGAGRSERPSPSGKASEIERPNAERRDDSTPVGPRLTSPGRLAISQTTPEIVRRTAPNTPAADMLNQPSNVQRLAEVPLKSTNSDALAHLHELTDQALNQFDTKQKSAAPAQAVNELNGTRSTPGTEVHAPNASGNVGQPSKRMMDTDFPDASIAKRNDSETMSRRLGDGQQLPTLYRNRMTDDRSLIAAQRGGSSRTEEAVKLALKWLAEHQTPDGRWDASQHGAGTENRVLGQDRQGAGARADTGITGLALLAFLASGHSHLEGQYREKVRRGLDFLLRTQQADGSLGGDVDFFSVMYCHGIASLAISEAYAITGDQRLKPVVQRAVNFTVSSQHPTNGGWRYRPGDQGDMSQFGWQVMALKSAELGGVPIPLATQNGMLRFLQAVSSGRHGGLAAYRPGEQATRSMTAEALTCRFFLGVAHDSATVTEATRFIAQELPSDSGRPNFYYWYYGTLGLYQANNEQWTAWNEALKEQLIGRQRTDGDDCGSWDPDTVWGGYGGRVYTTAMGALCLEVYYRYLPLLAR